MLTKDEFMEGIHILQNNYHKNLTTEQLKLFYENLKYMSKDRYIASVKQHIKNNQFMPNIAQLRGENKTVYANYEQRNYNNFDFSKIFANPM